MFEMLNLYKANAKLVVRIASPAGATLEMCIGTIIPRVDAAELAPDVQYVLLNAYLDYKGDEFKTELYARLATAEVAVEETVFEAGISNAPVRPIGNVLDMFDMDDVLYFVRDIFKVTPPPNLKETFDPRIESDGLGTRIQTYIQSDYYELAAFTLPIKAVIGLLGQYLLRNTRISQVHREYVLFRLIAEHPIATHPAAIKIREWATILMSDVTKKEDLAAITVIEKQMPIAELPNYLLAVVVIKKVSISAIIKDTKERNLITRVYNYIITKLKVKAGSNNRITSKQPLMDVDSASGDKESIMESYRMVTEITAGIEVELNWYTENMEVLIRDIHEDINLAMLEDVLALNQCFRSVPVTSEQIIILGYIYKPILDPRSFDYIGIDGVINLLSLAFVILWQRGHREIAMMLTAKAVDNTDNCIAVNITPNIRLDSGYRAGLKKWFPYEKQVNKTTTVSLVEESITALTNGVFKYKWLPNATPECLTTMYGDTPPVLLPAEFKNYLAKLIIDIEERNNAKPE